MGRGPVTVNVLDGLQRLAAPLAFGSTQNGQTWQAAPGAVPIIAGSVPVTGWASCASGCPAAVGGNASIYVATLPSAAHVASRDLWVNGLRAQRGYVTMASLGLTANSTGYAGTNGISAYPDVLAGELYTINSFRELRCPITAATTSQLTAAVPCWAAQGDAVMGSLGFGGLSTFEGVLEGVTTPGQFWIDTSAWKLYYYARPSDVMASADVEYPILEQVVTVSGASNVSFRGLSFGFSTWLHPNTTDGFVPLQGAYSYQTVADTSLCSGNVITGQPMCNLQIPGAVQVTSSSGITFSGDTFAHAGSCGLALGPGTKTSTVDEATIYDVGAAGVTVGDNARTSDEASSGSSFTSGNTVSRSFVFNSGMNYRTSPAIQVGWATGTTVNSNEILGAPYTGIAEGGFVYSVIPSYASNAFAHNRVLYPMRFLSDGAAIYTTGSQANGLASTYLQNVLANQANVGGMLYFDSASSWKVATSNVVQVSGGTACFAILQDGAPYISMHNSVLTSLSTSAGMCGTSVDSSNTVNTPTSISGIHDALASTIYAASGTPLRDPDVSFGTSASASATSSGSAASGVDEDYSTSWAGPAGSHWDDDLGTDRTITAIDVIGVESIGVTGLPVSYTIKVGDDPTFASSTTVATKDSSPVQPFVYGGIGEWPVASVRGRYVRMTSTSGSVGIGFGDIIVHGH